MFLNLENERVSEYEMKLMDIDGDHLGIPVWIPLFFSIVLCAIMRELTIKLQNMMIAVLIWLGDGV